MAVKTKTARKATNAAAKPITGKQIGDLSKRVTAAKAARLKVVRKTFGQRVKDYPFDTLAGAVRLSELFGDKSDLIVIHNMGKKCIYCTMWADGFAGLHGHMSNRAAVAFSTPDSPQVQAEFAGSRGWPFRMVSVPSGGFAADMGFEPKTGDFYPGVSVFHKKANGTIVRTGAAVFGPGDDFCALWPMFDLLKGGTGKWTPKYGYKGEAACVGCCG